MAARKCPVCGVSVKVENLERHVRDRHPRAKVDTTSLVTAKERQAIRAKTVKPVVTSGGLRIIAVLAIALGIVLGIVILNPFRGSSVGPRVGQTAPDFTLSTSTSGSVTLSDYRGAPVLLEFMDVDCHFCQSEASVLVQAYGTHGAHVTFLSVDVNFVGAEDTNARIEEFKATYGTVWTYALTDSETRVAYGVTATPTTLILDRNGVVVEVITGVAQGGASVYNAALERALQV